MHHHSLPPPLFLLTLSISIVSVISTPAAPPPPHLYPAIFKRDPICPSGWTMFCCPHDYKPQVDSTIPGDCTVIQSVSECPPSVGGIWCCKDARDGIGYTCVKAKLLPSTSTTTSDQADPNSASQKLGPNLVKGGGAAAGAGAGPATGGGGGDGGWGEGALDTVEGWAGAGLNSWFGGSNWGH